MREDAAVYHFDFSRSKSCFLQVIFFRGEKKIEIAKERKIGWKGGVVFIKESLSK